MKNTIKQVFHSGKFIVGFVIFVTLLLVMFIYPLVITNDPLEMVGNGNFFKPGTYVSIVDVAEDSTTYKLNIDSTEAHIDAKLDNDTRALMADWLEKYGGVSIQDIDVTDAEGLVLLWEDNYDSSVDQTGLTSAAKKKYQRIDNDIRGILEENSIIIAEENEDGELEAVSTIDGQTYVNQSDVVNKRTFLLGTDNFGRDVLTELVAAMRSSMKVGLIAGVIATLIGLTFGLVAGYVGGIVDNFITFITNLFTVIPSFIILVLVSYSIGEAQRGIIMVGVLIGITAWPWTTRSVRSQVISLRNRDHVNLSKLSGHSMPRIIVTDILPYVASYVVMAFILQISSGILSEAQLSMLGLGPSTTKTATLGLMMNWATQFSAHLNGSWWAYFPVILVIALISFSLNLMNTGLDQVFNPQLRD